MESYREHEGCETRAIIIRSGYWHSLGDPFVRERPCYRAAGAPVPRDSIGAICVGRGVKREREGQGEMEEEVN